MREDGPEETPGARDGRVSRALNLPILGHVLPKGPMRREDGMGRSARELVGAGGSPDMQPSRLADELLRTLHDEHAAALFGFALRLSGDRERAEEVVQETLLRAWQHPGSLDGTRGSVRAWLFTVARHLLADSWRRDAARPRTGGGLTSDLASTPDRLDEAVESWEMLEAMRRLTPEHRQVLVHCFYRGDSVQQAAAAIGIPTGTVKSRTFYALRALRVVLEEIGYLR